MNVFVNYVVKKLCVNFVKFSFNLPANQRRVLSYFEIYHEWIDRFSAAGISEPEESAGYIIAHLMGMKTFSVIPHKSLLREIPQKELEALNCLCQKRLKRMPVQYVVGDWDFFGVNLKMKPPVLIPRPETEELAGHVLMDIGKRIGDSGDCCKVLEVGSGSGAITLSLLSKLKSENVSFVAIDSARHAYDLTMENAEKLGLEKLQKLSVLLHELKDGEDLVLSKLGQFDVIVSNPPYISTSEMKNLPEEISRYEDWNALHGGQIGMDVINIILGAAKSLLTDNGSVWLEVDSSHYAIMTAGYRDFSFTWYRDIFGKDRFCHLTKSVGTD